jgi:hypothetical protein
MTQIIINSVHSKCTYFGDTNSEMEDRYFELLLNAKQNPLLYMHFINLSAPFT